MAWSTPTKSTIVADIYAFLKSLRPAADSTPFSDIWVKAHTWGHLFRRGHEHLDTMLNRLFPTTTSDEWLDRWLYFVGATDGDGGYGLLKPHTSEKADSFEVTFTGIGTIQNEELTDDAGRRYQLNESAPYVSPGAGTYAADLVSIDTGLEVNLEAGETLTFVSPPANVASTGTLLLDLDGGRALETNSEGRSRLVSFLQSPSLSGNWAHWKRWYEEALTGLLTVHAWVYGKRNNGPYGHGTLDIALTEVAERGVNRPADISAYESDVTEYFNANTPLALLKQARTLTVDVASTTVTVVVTYELAEGTPASQQCDWDAETAANKKDCAAGTAEVPDKLIVASAVYAGDVLASGDRVLIAGEEAIVALEPGNAAAPVSGAMNKFTVTTWPWSVNLVTGGPSGGPFAICAGGGLITDVYSAIAAYLDGIDGDSPDGRGLLPKIGPARGTYAAPQPEWDDTFRIDFIKSAATIAAGGWITGFKTVTVDGAAVDYGPAYTTTSTVQLVVYDEIELYQEAL
jgi:uncharacterized phage protein gp47/JayE